MLSRQESSLSSSSRRQAPATPPPPSQTRQPKSIGCMSGIIHLFSKYQNRHKRLTSGRKQDKCKGALPLQQPQQPPTACKNSLSISITENSKIEKQNSDHTHTASPSLSRDTYVPRSPTIPPEIRRSNSSESPRKPPASSLVARLMGLDDVIVAKRPLLFEEADNEAVTEKRRRLLRALDKCNEDLEALKRIIDRAAVEKSPENCMKRGSMGDDVEELSPVCVLDEFTRSPTSPSPSPTRLDKLHGTSGSQHISLQHLKSVTTKRLIEDDKPTTKHILLSKYSTTTEYASFIQMRRNVMAATPSRSSKAMVKSVDEVCNDIVWGEKREIERIELVLQDSLCKDLVEELVHDLKSCCMDYSLPFEGCKRRLCF